MSQARDPRPVCCVCRLKKRKCDRGEPACGPCVDRNTHEDCSYRQEDMPPPSSRKRRKLLVTRSTPAPLVEPRFFPTPLVVIDTPPPPPRTRRVNGAESGEIAESSLASESDEEVQETALEDDEDDGDEDDAGVDEEDEEDEDGSEDDDEEEEEDEEDDGENDVGGDAGRVEEDDDDEWEAAVQSQTLLELRQHTQTSDNPASGLRDESEDAIEDSVLTTQTFDTAAITLGTPSPSRINVSHLNRSQRTAGERNVVKGETSRPNTSHALQNHWNVFLPSVGPGDANAPVHISKELADRLVGIYLERDYAALPILELAEFRTAYGLVSSDEEDLNTGSSAFHGLLSIVFALVSLHPYGAKEASAINSAQRESLFNRGQKLSSVLDKGEAPWEPIQSFILQSQYLNATGNPKLAWTTIGFAISMADSFVLHTQSGPNSSRGRRERELARRLWHSAVIMERILTLQLGIMPRTSNEFRVPLPAHHDDDYVDNISGVLLEDEDLDRPSIIEFLNATSRLYSHVEDIIKVEEEFRMGTTGCAGKKLLSVDMSTFLKVDTLLFQWKQSLPWFLIVEGPPPDDPVAARLQTIIEIRYYYLRIRLYRPLMILALVLWDQHSLNEDGIPDEIGQEFISADAPMAFKIARECSTKCLQMAMHLDSVLEDYDQGMYPSVFPGFGENIQCLYTCGTILLAGQSCSILLDANASTRIFKEEIDVELEGVRRSLRNYKRHSRSSQMVQAAEKCLDALMILSDKAAAILSLAKLNEVWTDGIQKRRRSDSSCIAADDIEMGSQGLSQPEPRSFSWMERLPVDLK